MEVMSGIAATMVDILKVGDQVNFELKLDGNAGEVTAITKQ